MGKRGGISWFTAMKRAFMSPTKDNEKQRTKRRDENQHQDDEKRREKRRWNFRKQNSTNNQQEQRCGTKMTTSVTEKHGLLIFDAEQRHTIAVAAAAAQAAAATAQAAVEIIKLTRPSSFVRDQYAAILIQTTFRRYLARRALRALKGIVKLQALVRGHNARTQAKMMLRCKNSITQLQNQQAYNLGARRSSNISHEGNRMSMFAETNGLWESKYNLQNIHNRKSTSRDGSFIVYDWDDCLNSLEGVKEMLQGKKDATLKREKTMAAYANFSNQVSKTGRNKSFGNESEIEDKTKWLDRWMATKQWEGRSQACRSKSPMTPSPSKIRPLKVRSASPQCLREEKCYSITHTPNFGSYFVNGGGGSGASTASPMPNYMAATESAKAKVRSQSVPRSRPSTPDTDRGCVGSVKKRLFYSVPEPQNTVDVGSNCVSQNLRSPSFKSIEKHSNNMYSYYTDSIAGETSPCSTTDLRRWLR